MKQSEKNYQKLVKALEPIRVKEGELLKDHTIFKIGGPADLFFEAKNINDLIRAVKEAKNLKIPYFVLGAGSNILVSDLGFRGIVIKNSASKINIVGLKGKIAKRRNLKPDTYLKYVLIESESGIVFNRLVRFTLDQGLAGLEYFLGIPGTVGGAIYGNAHNMRRNRFFGELIHKAKILTKGDEIKEVERDHFNFDYDKSSLQETKEIVLSVILKLLPEKKEVLWTRAEKELEYRRKTQPQGLASAGCIFKNISREKAILLGTPYLTTSAGFLIDSCGLKGFQIGEAMFSKVHANFVINLGAARCKDVLQLIKTAKDRIKKKWGVELEKEIEMIGDCNK